jgi:hypothetical protein
MVLGMEQNFNAQKPCMVSYEIVLGIEENMDTKKHRMFSYEIITFKVLVLSKPSNTQNTFLVKLSFSGVWVLSKISMPKSSECLLIRLGITKRFRLLSIEILINAKLGTHQFSLSI